MRRVPEDEKVVPSMLKCERIPSWEDYDTISEVICRSMECNEPISRSPGPVHSTRCSPRGTSLLKSSSTNDLWALRSSRMAVFSCLNALLAAAFVNSLISVRLPPLSKSSSTVGSGMSGYSVSDASSSALEYVLNGKFLDSSWNNDGLSFGTRSSRENSFEASCLVPPLLLDFLKDLIASTVELNLASGSGTSERGDGRRASSEACGGGWCWGNSSCSNVGLLESRALWVRARRKRSPGGRVDLNA